MGSSPRAAVSDLPEDCHGARKASGSVKSSINQAVLRTGSSELAGLEREGKVPWAREVFTLLDVALVPQERRTPPQGKRLITGQIAWLLGATPEREEKKCQQSPEERGGSGHLASGPACPLLSSARAYYSWYHSIPTGPTVLCLPWYSPEASAAWETLQGLQTATTSQGSMLREKQGPHPPLSTSASQGAPEQYL